MQRKTTLILAFVLLFPMSAAAAEKVPDFIAHEVNNAHVSGTAHAQYMMIDLYDAKLYTPGDKKDIAPPFALSLTYLRDFNGIDIADRSIADIRSQGFDDEIKLAAWHDRLAEILGRVSNGTTITGIYAANGKTRFFRNGELIGTIDDPQFGKHFFDIWLGTHPDEPIEFIRYANPT